MSKLAGLLLLAAIAHPLFSRELLVQNAGSLIKTVSIECAGGFKFDAILRPKGELFISDPARKNRLEVRTLAGQNFKTDAEAIVVELNDSASGMGLRTTQEAALRAKREMVGSYINIYEVILIRVD